MLLGLVPSESQLAVLAEGAAKGGTDLVSPINNTFGSEIDGHLPMQRHECKRCLLGREHTISSKLLTSGANLAGYPHLHSGANLARYPHLGELFQVTPDRSAIKWERSRVRCCDSHSSMLLSMVATDISELALGLFAEGALRSIMQQCLCQNGSGIHTYGI